MKRLSQIGIDTQTIDALKAENSERSRETALLLIAVFDDRHEYVE